MKFKIYYNGRYQDEIIIEGDTIEEVREIAHREAAKRNWDSADCWSKQLED